MQLEEIEVFIEPDGNVRIEVRGVKGKSCLDVTKDLEKALGEVVERTMTPEALESAQDEMQRWQYQRGG